MFSSFGCSYIDLDIIISFYFVDDRRDEPACDKEANDDAAKHTKVEITEIIPDTSAQVKLHRDNAEHFDCADHYCYQHRDQRDVHIVVKFADRLDEGPTVGVKHQNAIGGVNQAHTRCEERREDEDCPNGQ